MRLYWGQLNKGSYQASALLHPIEGLLDAHSPLRERTDGGGFHVERGTGSRTG